VQLQLLEFLNGILDGHEVDTAAKAFVRHAVDQEAVEVLAQSVDHRVVAVLKVDTHDVYRARSQLHQVVNVAAIQRQVGNLSGVDGAGQLRVIGLDSGRLAAYFDRLACLPEFHLEVNAGDGSGVQGHPGIHRRTEARRFRGHLVAAGRQFSSNIG